MRVGWGVRVAGLATTSPDPAAPVAPVTNSKLYENLMFLQSKRAHDLPQTTLAQVQPRGGSGRSQGSLGRVWKSSGRALEGSIYRKTPPQRTLCVQKSPCGHVTAQKCLFLGTKKPMRACYCSEIQFLGTKEAPVGMLLLRNAIF